MSRVGSKPVDIPEGVEVSLKANSLEFRGPLGSLAVEVPKNIEPIIQDSKIILSRKAENKLTRSLHGLTRALVANAIVGVSQGFEKRLEIVGIGYRVESVGEGLRFYLGFSHPVDYKAPQGVKLAVEKNQIIVTGIDKQKVGQVAAEIRALKKPEPYKGKGIRYLGEVVHTKPGKAAKAVGMSGA